MTTMTTTYLTDDFTNNRYDFLFQQFQFLPQNCNYTNYTNYQHIIIFMFRYFTY
jgi:hypothetical protein